MPPPSLQFLGAAGTVTGSRFLVEAAGKRALVDCGMFQGLKANRRRNWKPFPVPPASIDTVVLTHAHIDHTGYLPALVRDGFQGRVVCTPETARLVRILLTDSARLQEEEARYANRVGSSKHTPALPLYTSDDAEASFALLDPRSHHELITLDGGIQCKLRRAGHILGAATVTLTLPDLVDDQLSVLFSGDLGRPVHPILAPPEPPGTTDVIVVESTYGNRVHPPRDAEMERLAQVITETAARGGTVVIPAFAVDRTEVVLHALRELELAEITYPSIIISASGMATGGRILHHLQRLLPDRRNSVVLTGFQAEGTRGHSLASGARSVKIFGRYVPVRADVTVVDGFSVHADADELLAWLAQAERPPEACYIVHGSESASEALRDQIGETLDWNAVVPRDLERVLLP